MTESERKTMLNLADKLEMEINRLKQLSSAQPEITEEQAIEYLQSTGWMQRHDRILTESTWDIIRCKDCRWSDANEIGDLSECNHLRGLVNASPNGYCNFAERRTDVKVDKGASC